MLQKGHRYKQQFAPRNYMNKPEIWEDFGEDMTDIVDEFFDYCANLLVEAKHGIMLNGIGYFANTVFDNKKVQIHKNKDVNYNFHTGGDIYTCYFFPDVFKSNGFESWLFRLNSGHKKKLIKNLKSGKKYKNHLDLFKLGGNNRKKFFKDEW